MHIEPPTACSLRSLPLQAEIVIALNITGGSRCTLSRRQFENSTFEIAGSSLDVAAREGETFLWGPFLCRAPLTGDHPDRRPISVPR